MTGPNDEIKELADTLDSMLERLDRAFDSQRRFVANASHELRTPLTIASTLVKVALLEAGNDQKVRQLGTTLLAVNQRHEKLIDGLLTLASSEQRAADFHPADLAEIAGHVASDMLALARKAGIAIETDLDACIVQGDAFLLERLAPENGGVPKEEARHSILPRQYIDRHRRAMLVFIWFSAKLTQKRFQAVFF
ncbi:MAG: hypothetical protein ABS76_06185 [Pelagibacterium sp. SCN 64-44]|nr:MAG: hypothetical protein ABS76_06185 [Pelagibacterium sp. SCN 64-44]